MKKKTFIYSSIKTKEYSGSVSSHLYLATADAADSGVYSCSVGNGRNGGSDVARATLSLHILNGKDKRKRRIGAHKKVVPFPRPSVAFYSTKGPRCPERNKTFSSKEGGRGESLSRTISIIAISIKRKACPDSNHKGRKEVVFFFFFSGRNFFFGKATCVRTCPIKRTRAGVCGIVMCALLSRDTFTYTLSSSPNLGQVLF